MATTPTVVANLIMPSAFLSLSVRARVYVTGVVCAGLFTIAHSLYSLTQQQIGWNWTVLAVLTLVSGSATVKLPLITSNNFSLGDLRIYFCPPIWPGSRHSNSRPRCPSHFVVGSSNQKTTTVQVAL